MGNPKGRPQETAVPKDISDFLESFTEAIGTGNFKAYGNSLARDYLTNGLTKSDLVDFMSSFLPYMKRSKVTISKFERIGDRAVIDGSLNTRGFGLLPLRPLYGSLILESGKWRWQGNQRPE